MQAEFKKIREEMGVTISPEMDINETNNDCNDPKDIDQSPHEILPENTNGKSDLGENLPQRRDPRILREQQEVAISQEEGRFLKQDFDKLCLKSFNKTKNQTKAMLLCLEKNVEDFQQQCLDEEENVTANISSKSKRKRDSLDSLQRKLLREQAKLVEREHQEHIREVALANDVVPVVAEFIVPGSLVVVNDKALPFVTDSLHKLGIYECVTTVNTLISSGDQAILSILGEICAFLD